MYTIINRVLDLLFVFLYWASPGPLPSSREKSFGPGSQVSLEDGAGRAAASGAGGLHHLGHLLLVYAHRLLPRHLSRHVVVTAFAVQSAVRVGEMLEKLISRLCVGHL